MLPAAAAGMLYGVQDVLTRDSLVTLERAGHEPGALLVSWLPYTLLVIALLGILLDQSAFDAAPLRISLPAMVAAEPVIGIVLGMAILGERLRVGRTQGIRVPGSREATAGPPGIDRLMNETETLTARTKAGEVVRSRGSAVPHVHGREHVTEHPRRACFTAMCRKRMGELVQANSSGLGGVQRRPDRPGLAVYRRTG
ncbi:DMT family transporter [Nonomuraea sp. NPDC004186]